MFPLICLPYVFLCALSLSLSVLLWMLTDAVTSVGLHSHTHSSSLSVSLLPCLSLFHLKGAATPQTGSIEIQISLYPVLIISKVTPTRKREPDRDGHQETGFMVLNDKVEMVRMFLALLGWKEKHKLTIRKDCFQVYC